MVVGRTGVRAAVVGVLGTISLAAACSSFSGSDPATPDGSDSDAQASVDAPASDTSSGGKDASPNTCDAGPGTRSCDERYVFVTNGTLPGSFAFDAGPGMALTRADQFCADQANGQSNYPDLQNRQWRAWMCTAAESAVGRAATVEARYITPDASVVFPSIAALRLGTSSNPISAGYVWTGCLPNGTQGNNNCVDWTTGDPEATGLIGVSGETNSTEWQSAGSQACSSASPIYCFESSP